MSWLLTKACSQSWSIKVYGHRDAAPDLVVEPPTVSDSNPAAGASFTLSAMVRNSGGSAAAATTLTYYRSTDDTISASDTSVGTDAVDALGAGASSDESIGLTAPATDGTYYYGACLDTVSDESDTTNNCSTAVRVTVGAVSQPPNTSLSPLASDPYAVGGDGRLHRDFPGSMERCRHTGWCSRGGAFLAPDWRRAQLQAQLSCGAARRPVTGWNQWRKRVDGGVCGMRLTTPGRMLSMS